LLLILSALSTSVCFSAQASACSWDSHCYGLYQWTDPPLSSFEGASVWINPSYMQLPSSGTNFLTHELWVGDAGLAHWVEAGWFKQRDTAFPGAPVNQPFGFWAEHRLQDSGIVLHVLVTGETLHNVGVAVYRVDGTSWHVGFDGFSALSTLFRP
jgi:hypothetical protein